MGLIYGGDVTKVWDNTATAQSGGQAPHTLGAIARIPDTNGDGDRWFVFVHNDTATAIEIGEVARIVDAGAWSVKTCAVAVAHPAELAGIAQVQIPADHYGWVQCWGLGNSLSDATGWNVGDLLVTTAAGETDVAASSAVAVIAVGRAASGVSGIAACDIAIRQG